MSEKWFNNRSTVVTVKHVDADKYLVSNMLTVGKSYPLVHETEEYYFVVDDTKKLGGYYKSYFNSREADDVI
ncbi:hypothetical protein SAMN05192557_0307 [Aliicoccus persicus]|uniref:Uncharacterized protein n=1 Tax=Aliicoccus persicus TaxID=930138 RepID=A0A662Z314_9STAP|nr:hypothetical protein SAMN05192557_0307 [Aliicoccus persicus]